MSDNLVTSEFRVSYPNLFVPVPKDRNNADSKKVYQLSMLFPARSDLTGKALEEYDAFMVKAKAAAQAAAKEKWGDKIPVNLKSPFLDQGAYEQAGYIKGAVMIRTSSGTAPACVDAQVQKILDSSEIYPGCYGRASVRAYAYGGAGTTFSPGVSFGLGNFQKTRDGESLGGRTRAEEDFTPVSGGSSDEPVTSTDSIFG